ncbi:MAG: hypothetical protein ABIQ53_08360, partial [Terracoccus sp.]
GELAARDTIGGDGRDSMWLCAPAPLGPDHRERAEAWRSALAAVGAEERLRRLFVTLPSPGRSPSNPPALGVPGCRSVKGCASPT